MPKTDFQEFVEQAQRRMLESQVREQAHKEGEARMKEEFARLQVTHAREIFGMKQPKANAGS